MHGDKGASLLAQEILAEAKKEAERILREAKKERGMILGSARISAKERRLDILRQAKSEGERIRERILAEGRMKAKREFLERREQLIERAMQEIRKAFQTYTSTEEYRQYLLRLVERVSKEIESGKIVLRSNKRDSKLLRSESERLSKNLGKEVIVDASLRVIGGVRAESADGSVVIDETLDTLLEREHDRIRTKIAKVLFEGS